ncbi:MAG: ATP-binding cassette subfamily C bacterial [Rhodospirillaceae bacterium]|nr:MAG: ATP-binding cassette subfamily C bacterial [Rhodospirillaceae bacterium]
MVGTATFQQILSLAPAYTERATIGSQVARIRDFESVREFFTGSLATVFIEVPFALFYVIVIGLLGGGIFGRRSARGPCRPLGGPWSTASHVPGGGGCARRLVRARKRQEFVVEALCRKCGP